MRNIRYFVGASLMLMSTIHVNDVAAAPALISSCQDIVTPGSYVLDNNLVASGHCLVLKTGGVSIDLHGFTIRGDGTGDGIVVVVPTTWSFVIKNGTILGFRYGINLGNSGGNVIEGIHASTNKIDGIYAGYAGNTVRNCTASSNGFDGISLGHTSRLSGNVVNNNGWTGINVGLQNLITDNVAYNNHEDGIFTGRESIVRGNIASENDGYGIHAFSASTVIGNTAAGNGSHGIRVTFNCNVLENTAAANHGTFGPNPEINLGSGCKNVNNVP